MKSPFPGMDPYLETRWGDVSASLAVYASDALNRELPLGIVSRIGVRVIAEEYEIKQRYLEIREARSEQKVITVIEFVNPANKRGGNGLDQYLKKRTECRDRRINLVEVDLSRKGAPSLIAPTDGGQQTEHTIYQAWVTRGVEPEKTQTYVLPLAQRLPALQIPLRPTEQDVLLDLQPLIDQIYISGRYSEDIDYSKPLDPPLSPAEAEWAATLLAAS
jgi:hypothetical protein